MAHSLDATVGYYRYPKAPGILSHLVDSSPLGSATGHHWGKGDVRDRDESGVSSPSPPMEKGWREMMFLWPEGAGPNSNSRKKPFQVPNPLTMSSIIKDMDQGISVSLQKWDLKTGGL